MNHTTAILLAAATACPPGCPVTGWASLCQCGDLDGDGSVDLWTIVDIHTDPAFAPYAFFGDINCDGILDPDDIADAVFAYFECIR